MVRELSTAAVRIGLTAIRIPIDAALGIARTALGNGPAEPVRADRAPEGKRATRAKSATPPRKRQAAKPKAKARTTEARAKPKPRATSSRARDGSRESPTKSPAAAAKGDAPQEGAERPTKAEEPEQSKAPERARTPTEARQEAHPRQAKPGEAVSGFPEPPGEDPGDVSKDPTPHHALANPVDDPDPTEWPDPYERREDPRDPPDPDARPFGEEPHPKVGSTSTSEPHPAADPEAGDRAEPPQRDKLDD
jgi:hypothetical protein